MIELNYSVLMSVYFKEKPEFLSESIKSMLNQTIKPNEIILVQDGELTEQLNTVINSYTDNKIVKTIILDENVGLGKALNIGLEHCSNELVARMDTDDISLPTRCEKQLKIFSESDNYSLVGTAIAEFIDDPDKIVSLKDVIENNSDIKKSIKFRNPINHPSVMFKKSHVINAGGYQHWYLNEDYFLWLRMIECGYEFMNLKESLVKMRITDDTYLRRGGWKYFVAQKKMFDYMLEKKMVNIFEYSYSVLIRFIVRVLLPNKVRKWVYINLLRKKV